MTLRLIFMGTPDFSVNVLQSLIDAGHEICAVYCQPPRKSGRGQQLNPSPVQRCAQQNNIEVVTPVSLKSQHEQMRFADYKADVAVVVAYGQLLPPTILDAPKYGCINIHASLLPRWRGAAPIQRAIMSGDKKTGVTIMQMEAGLDTGPMYLIDTINISADTTASILHDDLSEMGARLIVKALEQLCEGRLIKTQQPETGVTYAKKIEKSEARICFDRPARHVLSHIHGLSPFPGAWLEMEIEGKKQRIKILNAEIVDAHGAAGTILDDKFSVACTDFAVRPVRLQRQGKGPLVLAEFLRGIPVHAGTRI